MQKEIIIYGLIALLILWICIEQRLLMTKRYRITSDRISPASGRIGFVLLADLHNRTFGADNHRLIKRIDELNPDFIIMAGDIINKREASYPGNAFTLLDKLSDRYQIIYAYGNHEQRMVQFETTSETEITTEEESDYRSWTEFISRLRNKGVIFLDNESVIMDCKGEKLRMTGVSIDAEYFGFHTKKEMDPEYLPSLIGKNAEKEYQLLIAHNPVYIHNYAEWGADLILSGHMHGGMMRLPGIGGVLSPQAKFFPKYDSGKHTYGKSQLIVSRGLGSHSIMPRIFNIPELVYVELAHDSNTNE